MKVTAIIPAKGTSTRLPRKNLLPFGAPGDTLLGHKIKQLQQCSLIDEIVVGTDSDEIIAEAQRYGASWRRRDAYHCDEEACPLRERWRNLVVMVECDVVVWAHCTNPLVGPGFYTRAIEEFTDGRLDGYDSLCSVTPVQRHAWYKEFPLNFDPSQPRHQLAAELRVVQFQDGAIFIQPHRAMLQTGYFYGDRPALFEIEAPWGIDIDTADDYRVARALYQGAFR